jgi:large subunit ribosomal protein L2
MNFKIKKPTTSAQRHLIQLNTNNFTTKKPLIKKKTIGLINSSGRNNSGKITIRHKGKGHKKKYRIINFKRTDEATGIVCSIEYDPNRNSNIASIYNSTFNHFFYILSPKNLKVGDIVKSGVNIEPKLGYSLPIAEIPVGSLIHCVSLNPTNYSIISRAAGAFSYLKEKTLNYAKIELSSGEQRIVSTKCYATIGIVSNELSFLTKLGKAGRSRWLNCRPSVRGVAMNPVDHPHGGGEGKKSGKGKTPWGKYVKSGSTSKSKKKLIIQKNE